jgi:simple sugar transport system permease protein
VLIAGDIRTADPNSAGLGLELDAILAVVMGGAALAGGRPRVAGAVAGALIMQTLAVCINMWGVRLGPTLVVKALAVVLVCLARSPRVLDVLRGHPRASERAA